MSDMSRKDYIAFVRGRHAAELGWVDPTQDTDDPSYIDPLLADQREKWRIGRLHAQREKMLAQEEAQIHWEKEKHERHEQMEPARQQPYTGRTKQDIEAQKAAWEEEEKKQWAAFLEHEAYLDAQRQKHEAYAARGKTKDERTRA